MTPAPGCPSTVLVVDDDADIRESISEVLEDHGYRAIGAANGREAIDRLKAEPEKPCAILLDIMMPIMDGWQFRDVQRQDPDLSTIPVVVVTAHADVDEARNRMDVVAAMKKPIQLTELMALIAKLCP